MSSPLRQRGGPSADTRVRKAVIVSLTLGLFVGSFLLTGSVIAGGPPRPPAETSNSPAFIRQWLPSVDNESVSLSVTDELVRAAGLSERASEHETVSASFWIPFGALQDDRWRAENEYREGNVPPGATVVFADGEVLDLPHGSRITIPEFDVDRELPSSVQLESPVHWSQGGGGAGVTITSETDARGRTRYFLDGVEVTEDRARAAVGLGANDPLGPTEPPSE
jgi:hypothetical protein